MRPERWLPRTPGCRSAGDLHPARPQPRGPVAASAVELLDAARAWTGAYRSADTPHVDPDGLFFLAGHQPELFHPGVWFKNFALGELGAAARGAAMNLVIDSDTLKSTALRCPCGTPDDPAPRLGPFRPPRHADSLRRAADPR